MLAGIGFEAKPNGPNSDQIQTAQIGPSHVQAGLQSVQTILGFQSAKDRQIGPIPLTCLTLA